MVLSSLRIKQMTGTYFQTLSFTLYSFSHFITTIIAENATTFTGFYTFLIKLIRFLGIA